MISSIPVFNTQIYNSIFEKEYDYFVSLGHRCCVSLSNGYGRKSSFPFDWQMTDINMLPKLFKQEFRNFYPNSGVEFVHVYHKEDDKGNSLGVDEELTRTTFERRCNRLINLIKRNDRKILFIRSKYTWYWYKLDHPGQTDQYPIEHDINQLALVSDIIKNQYNNSSSDFLYIYTDINDSESFDKDPGCRKQNLQWSSNGTIPPEDLVLLPIHEQMSLADNFFYKELPKRDNNIYSIEVQTNGVRVEGMCYISKILNKLNISNIKDNL